MKEDSGSIPKEFYCFETNAPFTECKVCGKDLTGEETDYFIEKAVRNYTDHKVSDVVYEYAMCIDCAQLMNSQMSSESLENIQNYFANQPAFMNKVAGYHSGQIKEDPQALQQCVITGESADELEEYMLYGHFRGGKMVQTSMPYLLSGKIMDELSQLLSNETLGEIDDFMGEYFGGPPELEELWKTRRPVFF